MDAETVLSMGKYGMHVWASYGIALLVYGGLLVTAVRKLYRLKKDTAQ